MTLLSLGRASATGVAILLLAGCGGSSSSATVPQGSSAVRETGQHSGSWMKPGSSSGALLYAPVGCGGTCVISYPELKLVGSLSTPGDAVCTDTQGNVFLPSGETVTEYAHGGTEPIATLNLPGNDALGCAVDPKSNSLAVIFNGSGVDVAIFTNEQGTPTLFGSHLVSSYCGFDNKGNLFVNGTHYQQPGFAELPKGATQFTELSIPSSVGLPGQVQWDGSYITYESSDQTRQISRLSISGSTATVIGTTKLNIRHRSSASWLYGSNVVVPYNIRGERANVIGIWKYPKGGNPKKTIRHFSYYKKSTISFNGVAVSNQP
jgi:hypothetical protein